MFGLQNSPNIIREIPPLVKVISEDHDGGILKSICRELLTALRQRPIRVELG